MRLEDIGEILDQDFGEVLLFFNFDGMNRTLGAMSTGKMDSSVPRLLLGSEDRADRLLTEWSVSESPAAREILIRDALISAIRSDTKAKYFVPFRFESSEKDRTSHYLVHCSSHWLAFKFMKGVMASVGRETTEEFGKLEFLNDFERGKQFALFRQDVEIQKRKIIARVKQGPCLVRHFTNDWVVEETDPFSERDYKQMLLKLEEEGRLVVFDKVNSQPAPVSSRRKHRGSPTLAEDYWLRIPVGLFTGE